MHEELTCEEETIIDNYTEHIRYCNERGTRREIEEVSQSFTGLLGTPIKFRQLVINRYPCFWQTVKEIHQTNQSQTYSVCYYYIRDTKAAYLQEVLSKIIASGFFRYLIDDTSTDLHNLLQPSLNGFDNRFKWEQLQLKLNLIQMMLYRSWTKN